MARNTAWEGGLRKCDSSAAPSLTLQVMLEMSSPLRGWGWERIRDEKGGRAPYGVYHTTNTPKCEQVLCLKYSDCILYNIPQGTTNRCFRIKRKQTPSGNSIWSLCGGRQTLGCSSVIMSSVQVWNSAWKRDTGANVMALEVRSKRDTCSQAQPKVPLCQSQTHLSSPRPMIGDSESSAMGKRKVQEGLTLITHVPLPASCLWDGCTYQVGVCRRKQRVLVLLPGSMLLYDEVVSLL